MRGYLLCCAAVVVGVLVYQIGARALATPVHEIILLPETASTAPVPAPPRMLKTTWGDIQLEVTRNGVAVPSYGVECFHEGRATTCYVEEGNDGAYGTTTANSLTLALAPLGVVTGAVPVNAEARYRHGSAARITSPEDLRHGYTSLAATDRGELTVRIFSGSGTITIRDKAGRILREHVVIGTPGGHIDLGGSR